MATPVQFAAEITTDPGERPRDDELDLFGLTHRGKVRKENQDHFLLCTVHQQIMIHATSLPDPATLPTRGERLATIMLVADGVGGGPSGREASRLAAEAVMRYVASTMKCFHSVGHPAEKEFYASLREAAHEAHAAVESRATEEPGARGMATTLTLAVAVWPRVYITQVGDSRAYTYVDGTLRQLTRDQTMAQTLVDLGALPPEQAANSPLKHVLSRAIGGPESEPEVSRLRIKRGQVILLCSDGLTKHVTDDEIAKSLEAMTSTQELCSELVDRALAAGGTDNITVLAGRARVKVAK